MQMTLEKASKVEMIRAFGGLSLSKIVENKYPSVGALKKDHGLEEVEKVMSIIFQDLSESFEGTLSLEDSQEISAEISSTILCNLSLEDIYLTCRKLKMADKIYKLNLNKVMNALKKHLEEKMTETASQSYNNHLSNKHVDTTREDKDEATKLAHHESLVWYNQQKLSAKEESK